MIYKSMQDRGQVLSLLLSLRSTLLALPKPFAHTLFLPNLYCVIDFSIV